MRLLCTSGLALSLCILRRKAATSLLHTITAYSIAQARAIFWRHGCVVLPRAFDEQQLQTIRRSFENLMEDPRLGQLLPDNPRLQLDTPNGQLSPAIRKVEPFLDLSPALDRLVRQPVEQLVEAILGEPVALFEDKANCKQAAGGSAFPWHQDCFYWQRFSPELVSAFVCVDDATSENGCLQVVCGTPANADGRTPMPLLKHRMREVIGTNVQDNQLDQAELWDAAIPVPARAGSIILFSSLTPHSSDSNHSCGDRRAFLLTFNPSLLGSWYEGKQATDGGGGHLRQLSEAYVDAHNRRDGTAIEEIRGVVGGMTHRRVDS